MKLDSLLTEQVNPASRDIDSETTAGMLRIINQEDQKVAAAVEREIPRIAEAVDRVAAAIQAGGRLFYIGAGTSGRLGVLDAAECPPTFHVAPELVQGIMAGGEAALARATEANEDDPGDWAAGPGRARFRAGRRIGGDRRQRPNALCLRRDREAAREWERSPSASVARRIPSWRAPVELRSRR